MNLVLTTRPGDLGIKAGHQWIGSREAFPRPQAEKKASAEAEAGMSMFYLKSR